MIEDWFNMEEDKITFEIDNEKVVVSIEDLVSIYAGHKPEEMEHEVFKRISRQLKREYQIRKRGVLVHLSKISDSAWKELNKEYYKKHGFYPKQIGHTYVKNSDE